MKTLSLIILMIIVLKPLSAKEVKVEDLIEKGYAIEVIDEDISPTKFAKEKFEDSSYKSYLSVDDFVVKFLKWNPHIRGLQNLNGQAVYTEVPYSPYIDFAYAPNLGVNKEGKPIIKKKEDFYAAYMGEKKLVETKGRGIASQNTSTGELNQKAIPSRRFFGFFHVTLSQGEFNETIRSANLTNNQNSPFTVGAGGVYLFQGDSPYSLSSSVYVSKLTVSDIDNQQGFIQNTTVEIPEEVGVNVYLQRNLYGETFTNIYGGVDYERFSTLNFENILFNGSNQLQVNQEAMTFVTAGISLKGKIGLPTAFKLSGSYGVTSATNLSGYKFMIYANQKINNRFWYHFLYKQHILKDAATERDVLISRYGLGVGMAF